jgi:hypothetical protein
MKRFAVGDRVVIKDTDWRDRPRTIYGVIIEIPCAANTAQVKVKDDSGTVWVTPYVFLNEP